MVDVFVMILCEVLFQVEITVIRCKQYNLFTYSTSEKHDPENVPLIYFAVKMKSNLR